MHQIITVGAYIRACIAYVPRMYPKIENIEFALKPFNSYQNKRKNPQKFAQFLRIFWPE